MAGGGAGAGAGAPAAQPKRPASGAPPAESEKQGPYGLRYGSMPNIDPSWLSLELLYLWPWHSTQSLSTSLRPLPVIVHGFPRFSTLLHDSTVLHSTGQPGQPLHTPAARGGGAGLAMAPRVSAAAVAGGMDGGRPSDRDRRFNSRGGFNIGMQ